MNYLKYAIPPLMAGTFVLILAVIIYRNNPQLARNRTMSLCCFGGTIWLYCYSFNYFFPHIESLNIFLSKFSYLGVTILWASYLHFTLEFLRIKRKTLLTFSYIFALILIGVTLSTDLIVSSNYNYFWGPYPKAGKLHFVCLLYAVYIWAYCLTLLFNGYRNKNKQYSPDEANRIKYVFWAYFIGNSGAIDYVQNYGIEIYPFGFLSITLFFAVLTYAIIRHQLLDIKIVVKKTIAYSILVSIMTTLFFIIVYVLEKTFSVIIGYHSVPLAMIIIAFFSIIFTPLKNKIQILIDKYFFRGSIDQIDEENIKLREELQKSEKLKAVATLAAGMAHEIKNPLTSIKTFNEYLPQKYDDKKFMRKFHKIVGEEVDKINYTVKQLLEFSKPSKLNLKPVDLNKLLSETLELLNNDLLKKNIKVERKLSPLPVISVDPSQMKQVFLNLFLNAFDSMETDGVLTITTENKQNQILIKIKDTGCGIEKEDLKHIFDPFFSKKDGGTGLGLSVVHGIIEKHGGNIKVSSTVGKGTTFEIILPIS